MKHKQGLGMMGSITFDYRPICAFKRANNETIINCLPKPHVFAISNQVRIADEALCCSILPFHHHHSHRGHYMAYIIIIIVGFLSLSLSRFFYEWTQPSGIINTLFHKIYTAQKFSWPTITIKDMWFVAGEKRLRLILVPEIYIDLTNQSPTFHWDANRSTGNTTNCKVQQWTTARQFVDRAPLIGPFES